MFVYTSFTICWNVEELVWVCSKTILEHIYFKTMSVEFYKCFRLFRRGYTNMACDNKFLHKWPCLTRISSKPNTLCVVLSGFGLERFHCMQTSLNAYQQYHINQMGSCWERVIHSLCCVGTFVYSLFTLNYSYYFFVFVLLWNCSRIQCHTHVCTLNYSYYFFVFVLLWNCSRIQCHTHVWLRVLKTTELAILWLDCVMVNNGEV